MFLRIPLGEVEHGHDRLTEPVILKGHEKCRHEDHCDPKQYPELLPPLHNALYIFSVFFLNLFRSIPYSSLDIAIPVPASIFSWPVTGS
jgi:hypothetical protein